MYIVEFFVALLIVVGALLFGVFALSKLLAAVLAAALVVYLVRIAGSTGLIFVGAGFVLCAIVSGAVSRLL